MNWLDKFYFLPLEITFKANEDFFLPVYKGGTFRGGFGYAFKKAVCVAKSMQQCSQCILRHSCAYSYIFETPRPKKTQIMRKYQHIPHPFVLLPPLDRKRTIHKGEELIFRLILVGRAIEYLPYFIFVLERLGYMGLGKERGKCLLTHVKKGAELVYEARDTNINTISPVYARELFQNTTSYPEIVKMDFLTPLKLSRNRQFIRNDLSFPDIFRSLIRRIGLLAYFHCDLEPDFDFRRLIYLSKQVQTMEDQTIWKDWSRYSTRQNKTMPAGGLLGNISFQGDIEPFWPFLVLGQDLHVGKNTSFGLGKYELL